VINLPTEDLLDTVVRIGNCSSTEQDKFERFGLTALPSREVDAPGIGECHARFECRLHETRITADYPLFVWRIVHARVATSPRLPRTVHYRGDGRFMVSGREVSRRRLFRPDMLEQ
jgi:flavin reductase (DIM6/NTAB) family NADH-FMN oxidoreductase RutF